MTKFGIVCAASILLIGAAQAEIDQAKPELLGSYNDGSKYTITYFPDGSYVLAHLGTGVVALRGESTSKDGILKMMNETGAFACPGPAEYSYVIDGDSVTFSVVSDECAGRKFATDGTTTTRIRIPPEDSLVPQTP